MCNLLNGRIGQIEKMFSSGEEILSTYIKPTVTKYTQDFKGLKKIGIQANPGTYMKINGERIKIGKTGIYELDYLVLITSLSFEEDTQALIDYVY